MTTEAVARKPAMLPKDRVEDMRLRSLQNLWRQEPYRAVSTTNITLSGRQTIDGVALVPSDLVLVAGQTLGQNNGLYRVRESTWNRTEDGERWDMLIGGTTVYVAGGTVNAGTVWRLRDSVVTLGTTVQNWDKQGPYLATSDLPTEQAKRSLYRFASTSGNPIATVANTNTLTQLVSIATPAALAGDEFVFHLVGDQLNTSGSNTNYAIQCLLGGTQMFNISAIAAQGSGAARGKWVMEIRVKVEAIGGSPVIIVSGHLHVVATNNSPNWAGVGSFAGMLRSTAVNLTAASTLVINITPANTHSTIDWRLIEYAADRIR